MKTYDSNWLNSNRSAIIQQAKSHNVNPELVLHRAKIEIEIESSPEGYEIGGYAAPAWALGDFDQTYGVLGIKVSISKVRLCLLTHNDFPLLTTTFY